jgi:xylulokinase
MLLGLDIGTTAVKAVVLDPGSGILGGASRPHDSTSPRPSWSEADPTAWLANTVAIVPEACQAAGVDPAAISAVGIAGCVPCLLLLDPADQPLRPALLYNDGRAEREIAELTSELGAYDVLTRTGAAVTQQSIGPKLRWLERHEPRLVAETSRICGSYDWITGCLTGARYCERNWALESGLYDVAAGAFADDLVAAAGWDAARLSPIRDPGDVVGSVTEEAAAATRLRPGTPVVGGLADHVSSAFGAGLKRHGDVLLKLGGSVDILCTTDRPLFDARLYLDAHPRPGLWLPNGCMATGGSAVRWFQAELAGGEDLTRLDAEAAAVPAGADGLVILPYLLGEKTPVNDPLASGAIIGLGLGHTRGHLFRALLESFGHGLRHHLEVLAEHGIVPERARVTNGGASSALWKQVVADVTGLVLEPVVDHPGSALGAAFAAGIGSGAFASWDEIDRFVRLGDPVAPDPATASVYEERYAVYRSLYEPLRPSFRALRATEGGSPP